MAVIDSDAGEIVIRIVYDGPPEAGKTTSLRALAGSLDRTSTSPAEDENGRTLWFDWMEYVGGRFEGHNIRCQIVSVAGQRELSARRRRVISSADVVVFVADSARPQLPTTIAYLDELRTMIGGIDPAVGVIVQANKRDLPGAAPISELRTALAKLGWPIGIVESTAAAGTGIREVFVYAVRLALDRARELLAGGPVTAIPAGNAGTADDLLALLRADETAAKARRPRKPPALPTIDFDELDALEPDPSDDFDADSIDFSAMDPSVADAAAAAADVGAQIASDDHSLAAEIFRGVLSAAALSDPALNAFSFGNSDITEQAPADDDEPEIETVEDEPELEAVASAVDDEPAVDEPLDIEPEISLAVVPDVEADPDGETATDLKPAPDPAPVPDVRDTIPVPAVPDVDASSPPAPEAIAPPPAPAAPVPRTPTTGVPSGAIWPPVEGRAILQELATLELAPRRLPSGDWIAGLGTGWRVMSSHDAVFDALDDGRAALIQWARLHSAAAETLSAPRCIVLAEDGAGAWRLWQVVGTQPSLRDAVDLAFHESDSRDAMLSDLRRIAQYVIDADTRLSVLPLRLPCTLDNIGTSDAGVVYIGLMPSASTPVLEPRPRRESRSILQSTLEPDIGRDLQDHRVELDDLLNRPPLGPLPISANSTPPPTPAPPTSHTVPSVPVSPGITAPLPAIPAPKITTAPPNTSNTDSGTPDGIARAISTLLGA